MSFYPTPYDRFLGEDARGYLYGLLAPLQIALVSFGLLNDQAASLWVSAVAAALGFGVAAANATSAWRRWAYGLLAPAQALLVYYGVFAENQAATIGVLVASALGLGIAAAKTPSLG
ncbi:hypothetical protein IU451_29300 [Nocardia cyriacigeorgica]|uniref:phage holin n=1 Tax=Nocardia cyriacigeorgica TaxID=135487 RepID=UPI0018961A39|nr:hypothetical protein [Nocardia cyriacigeorgica]MBF6326598.1 hypothetical protein [Nocardia cyriacigeorgica]